MHREFIKKQIPHLTKHFSFHKMYPHLKLKEEQEFDDETMNQNKETTKRFFLQFSKYVNNYL